MDCVCGRVTGISWGCTKKFYERGDGRDPENTARIRSFSEWAFRIVVSNNIQRTNHSCMELCYLIGAVLRWLCVGCMLI